MLRRVKIRRVLLALALMCSVSCDSASEAPGAASDTVQAAPARSANAHDHASETKQRPRGRPLPAFNALTLDGERFAVTDMLGKRLLLFFFNPNVREAPAVTDAVMAVSTHRGNHNFEIVGVATGADAKDSAAFVASRGLDFQVLDDSSARLAGRFGLREPIALIGVDSEGFVSFGLSGFTQDTALSESVSSLVASINAWAASEGSRVQAYIDQLRTLSAVLAEFLAVPAIANQFGTQIGAIVSALDNESSRASQYLSSLG